MWFKEGLNKNQDQSGVMKNPILMDNRFFLGPGEVKSIIFLEEDPLRVDLHTVTINNSRPQFFTCAGDRNTCYFCQHESPKAPSLIWTILELTPRKLEDGTEKIFANKRVFQPKYRLVRGRVADTDIIKDMRRQKERLGSIIYCQFDVKRASLMGSSSSGTSLEFIVRHTKEELLLQNKWDINPYDRNLFRPLSLEEAKSLLDGQDVAFVFRRERQQSKPTDKREVAW